MLRCLKMFRFVRRPIIILALSFTASLLLHALIFEMLGLHLIDKKIKTPLVVELIERPHGDDLPARNEHPRNVQRKRPVSKLNLNLSSHHHLQKKWLERESSQFALRETLEPTETPDPFSDLGAETQGWSKGTQYNLKMDVIFTNENLGFFAGLHRKVDASLDYPIDLARARIHGMVRIQAVVCKDGRIQDFIYLKSDNDILQAYALTILIHSLRDPLPEKQWLTTEKAMVNFEFDFRNRFEGEIKSDLNIGVWKNNLLFAREKDVESKATEKIHEIFTHYVPPIIIIPGGFYIDFTLAYQFVKNVATNAPLESEVRQRRILRLHEQLLQTIHASKAKPLSVLPD